ncbi:inorganic phosphate transport PHO88 [Fistulina hepatica ATCC 64428]|uniref:Inorganic phosphate transport PHO88 n=1 Tax=Fistulina hepatica ATCC 64428 TaxID=1128425 RepID=A0A0D7A6J6_9AGAR|nr:inorganic phosphate transport PHO88 [Fistulina hepatica ATCC 64428]
MNAGVTNLAMTLVLMQVSRKIPFEDPEILRYVRIAYVVVQTLILSAYFYTSMTIKQKNDQTVLKYVEPATPMSGEQGKLVTTTVRDYDLAEVSKLLRGVYMGIAFIAFMHLYLGYTQPLFMQSAMGLKNLFEAKPVQVHIFGKKAEGDLKRPFKAASIFGVQAGPQTDAAAIQEAEKRIGAKQE